MDGVVNNERRNFYKLVETLIYVGNALEKYTETRLEQLHQRICVGKPNLGPCDRHCSYRFGSETDRWCGLCNYWRIELEKISRYIRKFQSKDWKQHESWRWAEGYKNIAAVFVNYGNVRDKTNIKLNDIATALSIWDNCKEFNLSQADIISELRKLRNEYFGHTTTMEVPDHKYLKLYNISCVLFQDPDVQDTIDRDACLQGIDSIKADDLLVQSLRKLDAKLAHMQMSVNVKFDDILNEIREKRHASDKLERHNFRRNTCSVYLYALAVIVIALVFSHLKWKEDTAVMKSRYKNCLSESYSIPFTTDLFLERYLLHSNRLMGRRWLIGDIQNYIFDKTHQTNGIIITADMGYGKSMLATHLICAETDEPGYEIRKHLIAYHLCQFDVLTTRNPAFMIRRMVGFISMKIPEFGNYVAMLPHTSIVFDKTLCEQDANGCFDQAIRFPLQGIRQPPTETQIIIIDALDECSDDDKGINRISELIRRRAHTLPYWIKILITSRDVIDRRLDQTFHLVQLSANDERNYNDIKSYIETETDSRVLSKIQRLFGSQSKHDIVETLMKKSSGNFLVLTHAIEYWGTKNETLIDQEFPQTLDRIFELNFERLCSSRENGLSDAKQILSILCASFYQIQKSDLAKILRVGQIDHMTEQQYKKTMLQLSLFFKTESQYVLFAHVSIKQWLVSSSNRIVHLSLEEGSARISEYLLNSFPIQNNIRDIGTIALQVTRSQNKKLEEKFISVMKDKTQMILENEVLHDVVKRADLPIAIDILSPNYDDIDVKNRAGLTASGVAAMNGNIEVFKHLLKLGANMKVVAASGTQRYLANIPGTDIFDGINQFMNMYPFEESNLLHIASQFGHLSIIEIIMTLEPKLAVAKNLYGKSPLDLACEFGHMPVLKHFLVIHKLLVDMQCLYLAARNQHDVIVDFILGSPQFNYSCISDEQAFKAFSSVKCDDDFKDMTLVIPNHPNHWYHSWLIDESVRPLSIWWKIHKDSALHVAARTGNIKIFKSIVSAYPESLYCEDSGGLTPIYTSIRHQAVEVFKLCMETQTHSYHCSERSQLMKAMHEKYLQFQGSCVSDMTVAHFLAIHGSQEMILEAYRKQLKIDLYGTDLYGVTPVHYAACHGNTEFLIMVGKLSIDVKGLITTNGSSPYHSAVSCLSLQGLVILAKHVGFHGLPYVVDYSDMTLLHYLFMMPLVTKGFHDSGQEQENRILEVFKFILDNTDDQILKIDKTGKNFLHYALGNGHFYCVEHVLKNYIGESIGLLRQNVTEGEDPVTYAITRLQHTNADLTEEYRNLHHINLQIAVDVECDYFGLIDCFGLLSPVELSLRHISTFLSTHNLMDELINRHFESIMLNSKVYFASHFLRLSKNTNYNFDQQIFEAIRKKPGPLNAYALVWHKSHALFKCGHKRSPIHVLVGYIDEIFESIEEFTVMLLIQNLFTDRLSMLDNCLDSQGRTILERAINGKSLIFIRHLLENNMIQLQSDIEAKQLLSLIIKVNTSPMDMNIFERVKMSLSGLEWYERHYKTSSRSTAVIRSLKDNAAVLLLRRIKNKDTLDSFCERGKTTFSLIHIAAANNMYRTIDIILNEKPDIVGCKTKDGVTALYLAKMFKAEETVKLLENQPVTYPTEQFEKVFIFKLSTMFVDSDKAYSLFRLIKYAPRELTHSRYNQRHFMRWIQKSISGNKGFKNLIIVLCKSTLNILRRGLSHFDSMLFNRIQHTYCRPYKTFLVKYQAKLKQIIDNKGLRIGIFFKVPTDLKMYSYIWNNISLFENYEKCFEVSSKKNYIRILNYITKRLIYLSLQQINTYNMRLEMSISRQHIERGNIYFPPDNMITGNHDNQLGIKDMIKYRFIDALKGFVEKDSTQFEDTSFLKFVQVQVVEL